MPIFKKKNEEKLVDVKFNVHKFTTKERPEKSIIISCFSEFGCEVMGAMYCIPRIKEENPDAYIIVMGWWGRSYLYRHLVDEFWETQEQFQWLRDYALAFHNNSKNLKTIEKKVAEYGRVVTANDLGKMAVGNICRWCNHFWGQTEGVVKCPSCGSIDIEKGLFADIKGWREQVVKIPRPSEDKILEAKKLLGPKPVAITARNRATYGRNLQSEFYVKLIRLLEQMRYDPIWIGEKQTTLECPCPHIVDMTRREETRDLELTLAIVSQCKFTVQFWTASTRLAAIMGVPYLLFESPDQLYGGGQESYRLGLCTMGPRKICVSHFLNVLNDHNSALNLVQLCIQQMERGDFEDVLGLIENPGVVQRQRLNALGRFGGV
jgi:hypothetical protein